MKIAVLVAGQLRCFNEKMIYSSLVEKIIVPLKEGNKNEVKLFFSLGILNDGDMGEVTISDEVTEILKASTGNDFHKITYSSRLTAEKPYSHYQQLYGIQKGFENIMEKWSPDVLIRTRPDFVALTPLKLPENILNDNRIFCLIKSDTPYKAHDCFFYMNINFYEEVWKVEAKIQLEERFNIYIGSLENCFMNKVFKQDQIFVLDHSNFKGGLSRGEGENLSIWD